MNIEPNPIQFNNNLRNITDILTNAIAIGSIGRGEFSPLYSATFNAQLITLEERTDGIYWADVNERGEPLSEFLPVSELKHPDMILDSYTLNPDLKVLLLKAKAFLISPTEISRTKREIKKQFSLAKTNISKNGFYRIRGEDHMQYDLETETFYIDSQFRKSVKYTYLRALQLLITRLILTLTPDYFSLDIQPSTKSKLDHLLKNGFIPEHIYSALWEIYQYIVSIYSYGVDNMYSSSQNDTVNSYTVIGSRDYLQQVSEFIEQVSASYFTQKEA